MKAKCKACRNMLPDAAAKKCTHCNEFQNYRRYLYLSESCLALIIALISVTSVAIPKIIHSVQKIADSVEIQILALHQESASIRLFAANSGNGRAAIGDILLVLPAEVTEETGFPSVYLESDQSRILEPSSGEEFMLRGPAAVMPRRARHGYALRYQLQIQLVHSDGSKSERRIDFSGIP